MSKGKKDTNGMAKNFEVIREQWEDYMEEIDTVIIPGIEGAKSFKELVHKLSAFGEEWFDKMPRLSWYLFLTTVVSGSIAFAVWKVVS